MTAASSPPPSGELLHRLCEDAVITYQVAMVGPRMVSGLPEYPYMPSDERTRWQENVLAIAAGTFTPRATCTPEQLRAWEAVGARVREMLAPEPPAADSPTPGTDDESAAQRSQRTGECICTSSEQMRGRPFPECGAHQQPDSRLRAAAPSPVETTEPPAEWVRAVDANRVLAEERAAHTRTMDRLAAVLSSVDMGPRNAATEPPAETQQDDAPTALSTLADELRDDVRGEALTRWLIAERIDDAVENLLAARPSADTETLRAGVEEIAQQVLAAHQRRDIKGCSCGTWGSEHGHMGQSHGLHVLAELRTAGLELVHAALDAR